MNNPQEFQNVRAEMPSERFALTNDFRITPSVPGDIFSMSVNSVLIFIEIPNHLENRATGRIFFLQIRDQIGNILQFRIDTSDDARDLTINC